MLQTLTPQIPEEKNMFILLILHIFPTNVVRINQLKSFVDKFEFKKGSSTLVGKDQKTKYVSFVVFALYHLYLIQVSTGTLCDVSSNRFHCSRMIIKEKYRSFIYLTPLSTGESGSTTLKKTFVVLAASVNF